MYHNVSRGASPSATTPRASKIDLENLEELQDAWCKRYEMLRDPPPPPQLNSPRSLRACAMANIHPQHTLQKLSLKQHLFRVLGNASMLGALPKQSTTEYRVLMQSALRSFQEAAVGLGTSQEKLAAYIAFIKQEELRGSHLASLRQLRRQLVTEEVFEDHQQHHNHHSRRASREAEVSMRSSISASQRGSSPPGSTGIRNVLWSSKVEEGARSRCDSVHSPPESNVNMSTRQLDSFVSAELSESSSSRAPPVSQRRVGAAETSLADFTPAVGPSGKLPYTPRDVTSLNSSYFGNRSIQSTVSNPCGAPLPLSAANNSALSPVPKRPVLAQRRQPQSHTPHPLATQNSHSALFEVGGDVDREMSIGTSPHDRLAIEPGPTQDLSTVSLNSNQLDTLPTPTDAKDSVAPRSGASVPTTCAVAGDSATHPVTLFHEGDGRPRVRGRGSDAQHVHSPEQLAPNALPLSVNNLGPQNPPLPDRKGKERVTACGPQIADTSLTLSDVAPAGSTASTPSFLFPPPVITQAEQGDGFVYYCANPTRTVTKFYGGARFPIAETVRL
ncbi:hypothetical protein ABB37_03461 [Leptomonas pyrrhocoris]|uniref:Uncharacterized protein n=1 Tax=Leptomonas pyrrhocoris TaxID=157538 RepID=A0A0N0DX44_LEPPY|nr:hypothetical protein ABB37_03461 [Leptomonas pyrrhocoris]XP_015660822.1 hypothetical protein ABB37_03461 [Leptomonas pyrrhocoris]KPA82382.1 hypothetical protein ABB37_03461 [Leptomonas pyrrhocoris]KPA82383.1 hypothetical protein ABB37_03461 [Leptomonas pyrrhocoris]|eukprot:XP_015660821.1 hypothetical protein ABB37_03461 [Leptomonas pyrrhocoris]